nr:terminase family protein [Ectothiorhodospira shaposhnikovii]
MQDSARFKVVVAGRRFGKTFLARAAIIKMARVQKRRIWYVAPSYRMAKQIMWSDLLDALPKKWIVRVNETAMRIELINRTVIELKGADKPDSLRGVGLHFLVMDEFQDMRGDVWTKVLRPTLTSTGGHALFIGTPKSFNHLYELWSLGQKAEMTRIGRWRSWQFTTAMSPFIPAEELEAARRDMDEKSFQQEFEASFLSMSGLVYYPFDRSVHVGEYPFNPALPIWVGQDFNIDPMSSVILQPQPSGEVWAVDEIVRFSSNTQDVCDELERRFWRYQKQITIYPDPAGGARQHARGESDLDIFRERGFRRIKYRRKHPFVADRVNAVNRMLRSGDGQVRLRINHSCRSLIESLEQTIYKPGSRDIDKSGGLEHSTDALGYPVEIEFPLRKIEIAGVSL